MLICTLMHTRLPLLKTIRKDTTVYFSNATFTEDRLVQRMPGGKISPRRMQSYSQRTDTTGMPCLHATSASRDSQTHGWGGGGVGLYGGFCAVKHTYTWA